MRNLLILFVLLGAFSAIGQGLQTLRFPDMLFVYQGYAVKLQLELPKKSTLVCVGCESLNYTEATDSYILKATDSSTDVRLEILSKKGVVLEQKTIPILSLPDPRMNWGKAFNGDTLTSIPASFGCIYDRSVPLNASFVIIVIEISSGILSIKSAGNRLSASDIEKLEALPAGTKIFVQLKIMGPDRKKREVSAMFYR